MRTLLAPLVLALALLAGHAAPQASERHVMLDSWPT
jgi:hypothetical protein